MNHVINAMFMYLDLSLLNLYFHQEERNFFWGKTYEALWRCSIPSKISMFVWKLLWQKLATRDALVRRGIISTPHGTCYICSLFSFWCVCLPLVFVNVLSHIKFGPWFWHGRVLRGWLLVIVLVTFCSMVVLLEGKS